MASSPIRCLHLQLQLHHQTQFTASSTWKPGNTRRSQVQVVKAEQQNEAGISRRSCANILIMTWLPALTLISASPASAEARLRRNRKAIPLEDYSTTRNYLTTQLFVCLLVSVMWDDCLHFCIGIEIFM